MASHHNIEEKLGIVFFIAVGVFVLELAGGLLSNSLALISDSFHVMLDFVAIGISLFAFRIAKRPHSPQLTFGFHRAEILAAFVNGISLVVISIVIFYEVYNRFFNPPQINSQILIIFAAVGLCANVVMARLLHKDSKSNLNAKGSYIHVMGDLVSTIGVITGGVAMYFVPNPTIDLLISVSIGGMIIRSGVILCRECLHIFMEGTPKEIKVDEISDTLGRLEEVAEVHDLHVWSLTSNLYAMSVHVKIKEEFANKNSALLNKIKKTMSEKFGIGHCTIQIEDEHDLINPHK
ncbi:MAG: cation transporter [Nitrosopumilales archaeon]|nr:MAG: cation transporter [Nitrosopumilales archaeon]